MPVRKPVRVQKMPASPRLKICLAQTNMTVGDFASNRDKILRSIEVAREAGAQLVVFPELAIPGYPPEDLLFKESFIKESTRVAQEIVRYTEGIAVILGYAQRDPKNGRLYNSALVAANKKVVGIYRKNKLPNYGVFDEKRYFHEGDKPLVVTIGGVRVGLSICEDIWDPNSFIYSPDYAGQVHVLINISASPYHRDKQSYRKKMLKKLSSATKAWVVYLNLVGGQDELVFDGGSLVVNERGDVKAEAPLFKEEMLVVDIPLSGFPRIRRARIPAVDTGLTLSSSGGFLPSKPRIALTADEELYSALVLGTADYVRKNGFKKVLIGLSGGIDSALVACIAVDALGAANVTGVTMPSPYTSGDTYRDSKLLATRLGIRCLEFRIDSLFAEYKKVLESVFSGYPENIAEENLQARIRGNLLMALSNKFGDLVLTTGNKSEMAAGYCTLYGDMAGGFAVIKDVPKTTVFQLSRWRNRRSGLELIPDSVLKRAPSAELKPDQKDQDSLPPYDVLDRFIDAYVENDKPLAKAGSHGLTSDEAAKIACLINRSEYKRRQAPPGIKITPRAFGRDRRMPITNQYREQA